MKYYDKKLLRFLYELTKLKGFLSHKDIAKELSKKGLKISPKTVERWFNFLKKVYKHPRKKEYGKFDEFPTFNFFPTFFYEKLGLSLIYVTIRKPSRKIFDSFPFRKYNGYAAWLFDPSISESVLLYGFYVPVSKMKDFRRGWIKQKKNRLVKDYKIYEVGRPYTLYSPWHKVIDEQGVFQPEKNDKKEISVQIKEFEYFLKSLPEVKLIEEVKNNPLILPVIFEQHRDGKSSPKLWDIIKEKLKEKSWNYIPKKKKKTEGVGIKRVQQAMEDIETTDLIHKMKIIYMPLELNHNFYVYSHLKFENKEQVLETMKELALNCVTLSIYPMNKKEFFLTLLINNKSFPGIIETFSKNNVKRVLFLQHEKSLPLLANNKLCIFDYRSSFDPKTLRWKD